MNCMHSSCFIFVFICVQDMTGPSGGWLQCFIAEADGDVYEHLSKIGEKTKQYKFAFSSTMIKRLNSKKH